MAFTPPPPEEPVEEPAPEEQPPPQEQPPRPSRPNRRRMEPSPITDPLQHRQQMERRRQRAGTISLKVIALGAFVFGVALHGCVAVSILEDDDDAGANVAPTATRVVTEVETATVTPALQPTPTPLPDRTSCDEIRGTQYRSVTEREFFLANCTGT